MRAPAYKVNFCWAVWKTRCPVDSVNLNYLPPRLTKICTVVIRVRLFNVGLHFFAEKVAFPCPSVDRFGKIVWGLMTLGQVKSVPNFY